MCIVFIRYRDGDEPLSDAQLSSQSIREEQKRTDEAEQAIRDKVEMRELV